MSSLLLFPFHPQRRAPVKSCERICFAVSLDNTSFFEMNIGFHGPHTSAFGVAVAHPPVAQIASSSTRGSTPHALRWRIR